MKRCRTRTFDLGNETHILISDQEGVTIELIVHYFGLRFLFKIHPPFFFFSRNEDIRERSWERTKFLRYGNSRGSSDVATG